MKKLFIYFGALFTFILGTNVFAAQPIVTVDQSLPMSSYDINLCEFKKKKDAMIMARSAYIKAIESLQRQKHGTSEHMAAIQDFTEKKKIFDDTLKTLIEAQNTLKMTPLPSTKGKKVFAEVSGPGGWYIRGASQFFPATTLVSIYPGPGGTFENGTLKVSMANLGPVNVPLQNFSSLETPGGRNAFQKTLDSLKMMKPGTQIFIECKDPGCRVVCNDDGYGCDGRLTCQTEVKRRLIRVLEGKYRITWNAGN